MSTLRTVVFFLIVAVGAAIGGQFGREFANSYFGREPPSREALIRSFEKEAEKANRAGPVMIDEHTRLDRRSVGPGLRVNYHYTLPTLSSRDIDAAEFVSKVRPNVVRAVCSNKDMDQTLRYGTTYSYEYVGNNGIKIATFDVNNSDCDSVITERQ